MRKLVLFLFTCLSFVFCDRNQKEDPFPCIDGICNTEFVIDSISTPGAKIHPDGYWRVKYQDLNYFTIRGKVSELDSQYVLNGVPLIETSFDSDYWIVFDTIEFKTPMYSYLGWFNNQTLDNPISIGNYIYTIRQLVSMESIFNLAGYEITKNTCLDCPYSSTLFGTHSKYNYYPTQNIFFDDEMAGDTASIFVQVVFNTDVGKREIRDVEMKIIFE